MPAAALIALLAASSACNHADSSSSGPLAGAPPAAGGASCAADSGGEATCPDAGPLDAGSGDGRAPIQALLECTTESVASDAPETFGLDFQPIEIPEPFQRGLMGHLYIPDSKRLLMWHKSGEIGLFQYRDDTVTLLRSDSLEPGYWLNDCAIQGVLDPNFEENDFAYFTMCESNEDSGVFRFRVTDWNTADPDETELVQDKTPVFVTGLKLKPDTPAHHNAGAVGFDDAGYMWVTFGEKGQRKEAQDTKSPLGSLLRFGLENNRTAVEILPHPDNPWPDLAPLVYTYGLRSPFTATTDHRGRIWVGEVGANEWESIHVITGAGQNLGWPEVEGCCDLKASDCERYSEPILSWPHDVLEHRYVREDPRVSPSTSRVAWVGLEVQAGKDDPYDGQLHEHVLFGDGCLGYVRAAKLSEAGELVADRHLGHLTGAYDWQQRADGWLTVAAYGGCSGLNPSGMPPKSVFAIARPRYLDR